MVDREKALEEEIEKLIDEKIEGREGSGIDKEQLKQEILGDLEDRSEDEKGMMLNKLQHSKISRRKFLKALGLGAGGLALSSQAAAAWSLWQPKNKGVSDINADTVDGKNASELGGRAVKRGRSGDVYMQNVGTVQTGGFLTTTGIFLSAKISTSEFVAFDSFTGKINPNSIGGDLKIYRNGSLEGSTNTEGGTTNASGAPRASNVTWTVNAVITDRYGAPQMYNHNVFGDWDLGSEDTSWAFWRDDSVTGTYDALKIKIKGTASRSSKRAGFYARTNDAFGNTLLETHTTGGTVTTTTTLQGPWSSPTIYGVVHNEDDVDNSARGNFDWYFYNNQSYGSITMKVNRNQFTSY